MKHSTLERNVSCVSWIFGQTSALLGVILTILWGFDLVLLRAQTLYAQSAGEEFSGAELWAPPFGPSLIGLGIALAGWLVSHLGKARTPTPVIVGAALNLMALILAILASAY